MQLGTQEIARPINFRKRTFQSEKLVNYFSGSDVSVFVEENEILDTGGGLKRISLAQNLGTVFTINSVYYTTLCTKLFQDLCK